MANEITVNVRGSVVNGNMNRTFAPGSKTFDQAGVGSFWSTWTVTTDEALAVSDITTEGWCFMQNVEAAGGKYVSYGPDSGGAIAEWGRLEPGEMACTRLEPGITIRAVAESGAVDLDILILED